MVLSVPSFSSVVPSFPIISTERMFSLEDRIDLHSLSNFIDFVAECTISVSNEDSKKMILGQTDLKIKRGGVYEITVGHILPTGGTT